MLCGIRWLLITLNAVSALSPVVKIGAIFTEESRGGSAELAFKYAVYRINKERNLLPNSTLVYDIQYTPNKDSFHTYKRACLQIKSGAVAIFSGGGPLLGSTLNAMCRTLHIPHLFVSPQLMTEATNQSYTVSLYPPRELIIKAFSDFIRYLNWTRAAVIYENYGYGELNILNLAKDGRDLYAIRCNDAKEYRRSLAQLKAQRITHIIVDTDPNKIRQLSRAILQLQMNNEDYHYVFTSFDMELFDLEDFFYNRVNMSGWRLVDRESDKVREALQVMEKFHPIGASILSGGHIKTETALLYDAVQVLALALASMEDVKVGNASCDRDVPWIHGRRLMENINGSTPLLSGVGPLISPQSSLASLAPLHPPPAPCGSGSCPLGAACSVPTGGSGVPSGVGMSGGPGGSAPTSTGSDVYACAARERGHYVAYEPLGHYTHRDSLSSEAGAGVPPGMGMPAGMGSLPRRGPCPPGCPQPLHSFALSGGDALSDHSTPTHSHSRGSVRETSPYKKSASSSPGHVPNRLHLGGNVAHCSEELEPLTPSRSTERLNREMQNLEGLMKDLSAITQHQFHC